TSWEICDPLVHYTIGDLTDVRTSHVWPFTGAPNPRDPTHRYLPWDYDRATDPNDLARKDPLIDNSDAWEFPTNKYPTVGWLGRVHRGTPWQTIYMKAPEVNMERWTNWSGSTNVFLARMSMPTNDWRLFDLF